ncbi:ATP-binding protein [Yinghuangia soli]|uniref:ATP-binding protein n=1 Tax=Yinghuangia soli TaxID=2908204 RepID=A0AA41Q7J0_9ACTN|nr:ATP-binding protein [Yinghuangia soli]MCF2531789.1 ATP-binding protein [Yinghuangia soli]
MSTTQTEAQFEPLPASVGEARHWAAKWLAGQGIPDHVIDDVTLCLSEVTTNAVRHHGSTTPLHVRLAIHATVVRLSVQDDNCAPPSPRSPAEDDENGRGYVILDALAATWGFSSSARGKTVWCDITYRLEEQRAHG